MAWNTALTTDSMAGAGLLTEADVKKARSSWPIALFLAIIISAPYFIWRIISSLDSPADSQGIIMCHYGYKLGYYLLSKVLNVLFSNSIVDKKWAEGLGEHYTAHADYDFNAGSEQELSFRVGQTLRLAPRSLQPRVKGWLLAAIDRQHIGLVPANYVRILAKHDGTSTST